MYGTHAHVKLAQPPCSLKDADALTLVMNFVAARCQSMHMFTRTMSMVPSYLQPG